MVRYRFETKEHDLFRKSLRQFLAEEIGRASCRERV